MTQQSTVGPSETTTQQQHDDQLQPEFFMERLHEGEGEFILSKPSITDVDTTQDNEVFEERLLSIAKELDCQVTPLRTNSDSNPTQYLVRQFHPGQYVDLRLAICGNVDSGKSTLVGVLSTGELDDGRGLARSFVFVHRHEATTGRTSAVAHHIIGFDAKGTIVNHKDQTQGGLIPNPTIEPEESEKESKKQDRTQKSWKDIVEKSAKIANLIDLAGHERYLKTTVFGMVGNAPDYSCIIVGANAGILRMTKEHIGVTLSLKLPLFFVVTKVDICPPNILKETLASIHKILKLPGIRKLPYMIKNRDDILKCVQNMPSGRVAPVFLISSVTGENVNLLRMFINLLPVKRQSEALVKEPVEFVIDNTYFVHGVGTVVSGIMHQGEIKIGDTLRLGPDGNGHFRDTVVKSIHCKRVPVERVIAGQQACFALKKERRSNIRKGMVIVHPSLAKACWEFEAEILVLYHSTLIRRNYQPTVHTLCVRQAAKILSLEGEELRTGDKSKVKFRFLYKPEYLKEGSRILIREGRTRGFGLITRIFQETE